MNKLTKVDFARPLVPGAKTPRRCDHRRLVCFWTSNPTSGRLAGSWESAGADRRTARKAGEPPPVLAIAA